VHHVESRLAKLEESHTFTEHTSDQLNEAVLSLSHQIDRLTERIAGLEKRISEMEETSGAPREEDAAEPEADPDAELLEHFPPHAAGPRPRV